ALPGPGVARDHGGAGRGRPRRPARFRAHEPARDGAHRGRPRLRGRAPPRRDLAALHRIAGRRRMIRHALAALAATALALVPPPASPPPFSHPPFSGDQTPLSAPP